MGAGAMGHDQGGGQGGRGQGMRKGRKERVEKEVRAMLLA